MLGGYQREPFSLLFVDATDNWGQPVISSPWPQALTARNGTSGSCTRSVLLGNLFYKEFQEGILSAVWQPGEEEGPDKKDLGCG